MGERTYDAPALPDGGVYRGGNVLRETASGWRATRSDSNQNPEIRTWAVFVGN
jgi:hypothetical protein